MGFSNSTFSLQPSIQEIAKKAWNSQHLSNRMYWHRIWFNKIESTVSGDVIGCWIIKMWNKFWNLSCHAEEEGKRKPWKEQMNVETSNIDVRHKSLEQIQERKKNRPNHQTNVCHNWLYTLKVFPPSQRLDECFLCVRPYKTEKKFKRASRGWKGSRKYRSHNIIIYKYVQTKYTRKYSGTHRKKT